MLLQISSKKVFRGLFKTYYVSLGETCKSHLLRTTSLFRGGKGKLRVFSKIDPNIKLHFGPSSSQ